jgi:hypothetical protein
MPHRKMHKIYRSVTVVYLNSGHYPSSCLLFKTQLNSIYLSVPHRKHITSPLRAQQFNAIYRSMTIVYDNSGHYTSSCLLFKTQLNSILVYLSVPHRKHITSPLRAQQFNAIYRSVTIVYDNSGHYTSSCLLFKTQLYRFVRTSQETHYGPATSPTG